jgi:hypothetical protein
VSECKRDESGNCVAEATYNKATGWLSITFPNVPSVETRTSLKAEGFRYEPVTRRWRASFTPEREGLLKQIAGRVDEINIQPNYERKAEIANFLAERHAEKSSEFHARADAISSAIPFGQPILVGHHSEAHHRSDLAKIDSNLRKSGEEAQVAKTYEERAQRYEQLAQGESPITLYNRIKGLEAEQRKFQRRLEEAQLAQKIGPEKARNLGLYYTDVNHTQQWLKHYEDRLAVERQKYTASGGIPAESMQIKVGDRIETQFGPARVTKISKESLQVDFEQPSLSTFHKIDLTAVRRKL